MVEVRNCHSISNPSLPWTNIFHHKVLNGRLYHGIYCKDIICQRCLPPEACYLWILDLFSVTPETLRLTSVCRVWWIHGYTPKSVLSDRISIHSLSITYQDFSYGIQHIGVLNVQFSTTPLSMVTLLHLSVNAYSLILWNCFHFYHYATWNA